MIAATSGKVTAECWNLFVVGGKIGLSCADDYHDGHRVSCASVLKGTGVWIYVRNTLYKYL